MANYIEWTERNRQNNYCNTACDMLIHGKVDFIYDNVISSSICILNCLILAVYLMLTLIVFKVELSTAIPILP